MQLAHSDPGESGHHPGTSAGACVSAWDGLYALFILAAAAIAHWQYGVFMDGYEQGHPLARPPA